MRGRRMNMEERGKKEGKGRRKAGMTRRKESKEEEGRGGAEDYK